MNDRLGWMTRRLHTGPLEHRVMGVLWDEGQPLTPRQVHERIEADCDLAYTTVLTILVRLWHKGELGRQRVGRAFSYRPVMSREEYFARRMREVLDAAADPSAALSQFVRELPPKQRLQVRRILGRGEE